MIDKTIVDHLTHMGWTAYRAGSDLNISHKPCVIVSIEGTSKPWLPLQATEYSINIALYDSAISESQEALLMDSLALLDCGEKCDLFQMIEKSAGVDGDDWVTTWNCRYIES